MLLKIDADHGSSSMILREGNIHNSGAGANLENAAIRNRMTAKETGDFSRAAG